MSMRAIDADALSGKFSFYDGVRIPEKDIDGFHNAVSYHDIKDETRKAPTIEPPANWTPCSVALPDIGEEVDVTYQINGKREVGCGKYIGNEQWIAKYGYGHDDEDGEVLAWKPCQEPYRGGE